MLAKGPGGGSTTKRGTAEESYRRRMGLLAKRYFKEEGAMTVPARTRRASSDIKKDYLNMRITCEPL